MKKKTMWLVALLAFSLSALAAVVTINLSDYPYNGLSMVQGQNIYSEAEIKMGIGFEVVKMYNGLNSTKLGNGDQAKVIYQDGSSERYAVGSLLSSGGVLPIPGTQQSASGSGGGGPGGYPDDPGYVGGDNPFSDCFSETVTGCVSVGDGPMQCETYNVLNCPFG